MSPHEPPAKDRRSAERRTPQPSKEGAHAPEPVDTAQESVAGEEDPGASVDVDIGTPASPPRKPKE